MHLMRYLRYTKTFDEYWQTSRNIEKRASGRRNGLIGISPDIEQEQSATYSQVKAIAMLSFPMLLVQ